MFVQTQPHAADLRSLVDDYFTCEFATMSRSGMPVTWPAVPMVDPVTGTITLTTSIGAPRKALNVRRDPRVALLFSDPTGSGRTDLPQVLVRGTAVCPDEIRDSPAGMEEFWARQYRRQPASMANSATPVSRYLMDMYYMRLVITVTPTSIEVLPPLRHPEPAVAAPTGRSESSPFAVLARELPRYSSGVLAWPVPDEPPVLRRVGLTADPAGQQLRLTALGGSEPPAGPAGLLLHAHDERMWGLRQAAAFGTVVAAPEGLAFRPDRMLAAPPFGSGTIGMLRLLRDMRRASRRYLEKRGIDRPRVDWAAFKRLQPSGDELRRVRGEG